jgi:hypothetical protein
MLVTFDHADDFNVEVLTRELLLQTFPFATRLHLSQRPCQRAERIRATLSQAFRANERERRQTTLWHLCARLKLATPKTHARAGE